ncbi:hypothetical protein Y032_0004g2155 [Ancylostoma ceylanicum]|uniref:Major facilitator superfamily (MFS) profile domain-containing protein n=1 Tax=Ancylostoma ceylanicum TaxID=53326 RepID=A0A016VXE1_9BILA|nr:hypothetical protein Y032_0004g2155 [Ancylostoma ceylanicum]
MASERKSRCAGKFRTDILILITYQLCHAYTTQQLFPILLNYVPPVGCFDGHCTNIKGKCYEDCPTCPDVCPNSTTSAHDQCVKDNEPYFESAAMEYQIYCRPFFKSFSATSVQYAGVLIGNFIVGYCADRFGRRLVLLAALLLGIPELFLCGVIKNLIAYYVLRFAIGLSVAGTMSVGWTYCSEMISPQHRFKLRTITSYSLGRVFMVALAHVAGEWRFAIFLHGGVCILTFLLLLFLPESIIWLKRKGDYDRVEKAQRKIDWINGLKTEEEEVVPTTTTASKVSLLDVIRDANLRVGFFVLCVMWFFGAFCEYSIDLNGEDMSKNIWIGQYLSGALASVIRLSFGIADGYLPWLGRRKVFIIGMTVCTLAAGGLIALLYLGYKGTTLYLVVYLAAYNSIALIWEPNFVCASELMPTDVRATTTAFLGILSRVATIIASMMVAFKTIHEPVIMWTVLAANLINFTITARWLKETKNCNLENIGVKDG